MRPARHQRSGENVIQPVYDRLVIIVAVATLVAFSAVSAGEGDEPSRDNQTGRVSPNQSASVEMSTSMAGATRMTHATVPPVGGDTDATLPAAAASARPSVRVLRRGERSGPSQFRGQRRAALDTPWYRTGLGALVAVLALVGVAAWLMRRWVPGVRTVESGVVRIVGRTVLSPKHTLMLVALGRRFVLVGVCGDRVTTISEVTDPDEVAALAARIGSSRGQKRDDFGDLLAGEEDDYRPEAERHDARGRTFASASVDGARGSLGDLLRRLKTLHRKAV